jgi:RNA recognition motif-containing protein
MATKLFVGSLSFNINNDKLKELFDQFGMVVSANVITDRDSGNSKGFGFVEMETDQEAQAAITGLNGKEVDGRTVVVNIARPKEDRPARPSFNDRRRY